jgi:hypothetical protein
MKEGEYIMATKLCLSITITRKGKPILLEDKQLTGAIDDWNELRSERGEQVVEGDVEIIRVFPITYEPNQSFVPPKIKAHFIPRVQKTSLISREKLLEDLAMHLRSSLGLSTKPIVTVHSF